MKILIADDDEVTLAFLTAGLRHEGFQVETAADAMQAVMRAIRSTPDAIVLDIKMPGGTGITALQGIRQSDKTRHLPVIAITGSSTPEVQAQMAELGALDCLEKPIDVATLAASLRALSGK